MRYSILKTVSVVLLGLALTANSVYAAESCYAGSDSTDELVFVADRTDGATSTAVGSFGVGLIEALGVHPTTGVLYGANANQLGTINFDTGVFAATSSTFGTAFAANGDLTSDVTLSDVDAIAFDLSTGFLYGVQRRTGDEILFRIDPTTGALVPGVFGGNDYLLVSGYGSTDDIAIDNLGVMYASSAANLYTINFAAIGTTAATLVGSFGVGGPDDMEGLSTDIPGNLIGTTGANNSNSAFNNSIWDISKTTGAASNQVSIPIGGDYEGVICALATIDLSLSKTVALTNDADSSGDITPGDQITYSISVENHDANLIASAVEVTDNINTLTGLTFVSSSSTKASPPNPYNSATGVWSLGAIPANTTYQLSLVYSVNAAAGGSTITNIAQITQSADSDPDSEPNNDDGDQSEDDEDNATITVNFAVPTISKSFGTDPIALGGISTLTITLGNTNGSAATLTSALVDTLPTAGNGDVVVAAAPNIGGTCNSANVTAVAGASTITFANGATIPATTGCTITVDVTSSIAGIYTNTIPAGALQTDLGNNIVAASDNLTVSANPPPTVTKSFSPSSITSGGNSQLIITLGNTNASAITLLTNMDDNLPIGVTATSVDTGATTCTDASVDISVNTRVRYTSGSTIPSGGCNIVVNVTSITLGTVTNTIAAGALQTDAGSNSSSASSNLTVTSGGGGGPPTCPAGTTLTSQTGNAVSVVIDNGVRFQGQAVGGLETVGTTPGSSNSAELNNTGDDLGLDLGVVVPENALITLSISRDNGGGRVDILTLGDVPAQSTNINNYSSIGSYGNGGSLFNPGTQDDLERVMITVPSGGLRYLGFTEENGDVWLDGVEYSEICITPPMSDLSITKDDGSLTYTPGGTATYTIVVTNNGPDNVTGATIVDNLPNGVTMTAPWTCTPSSASSSCNTAPSTTDPISIDVDIVNGDSITVTVPVQFSSNMGDY